MRACGAHVVRVRVQGFADVANAMEKVSEQKSVIDEEKGMTLVEISRTVEEISSSIPFVPITLVFKELR